MTTAQLAVKAVTAVPCFKLLDEDELQLLAERLTSVEFPAGTVLCREGEHGDCMYVIDEGEVSVIRGTETSVEVALLQPGDIAGEMCLLGRCARTATLRTRTPTRAWQLERADFEAVLEQHPSIARALLSRLSHQLSAGTSTIARLLLQGEDPRFQVAFFDTKPYTRRMFDACNRYAFAIRYYDARLDSETAALAAGCKAVCAFVNDRVDEAVVQALGSMGIELIAMRCAGYNNVDLAACARAGISVVRVPAYSPYAVAEHAVALMMTLNRRVHRAHNRVKEGNFSLNGLTGFDMHGKSAGVVGTGKIGACLCSILHGFGCRLLLHDPYPNADLADRYGAEYVPLEQIWAESDIVSLHAPLTETTFHLVNEQAVTAMKPGVMLINTSRGALVDTNALLGGLKSGKIGFAGLDVYEEEGGVFFEDLSNRILTDDQLARLTTFNNVIVTSHQAFLTREALSNIADTTLASIHEFTQGKTGSDLTHAVTQTA